MNNTSSKFHRPVLVDEVLKNVKFYNSFIFVDATLGGGGHVRALLKQLKTYNLKPITKVIGIDCDQEAIDEAKNNLREFSNIIYIKDNFVNIDKVLDNHKIDKVDTILLDLGVSSHQLDDKSRGFSFSEDETNLKMPLDMRMDKDQKLTAKEIVNSYSKEKLTSIIYEFGEEGNSRKIADAIVKSRKNRSIETVGNLINIIKSVTHRKMIHGRRKHFATNIFRALRIEVNDELQAVKDLIPIAIERLKPGGRLLIISFHSLEDRIVKHDFRNFSKVENPKIKTITKKPIIVTQKELSINPRSRSAKLRVVEKL